MRIIHIPLWVLVTAPFFLFSTSCGENLNHQSADSDLENIEETKSPLFVASSRIWSSPDIKVC